MDNELANALNAEFAEGAGDTSTETPETPTERSEAETAEETPADTGSEPTPTGDDEWRFNSAEWDSQHPDLAKYRKQLQADYTKAQQQLADQRKAVEGLAEDDVRWLRTVTEAARLNPAYAKTLLQQAAEQLAQQTGTPPDPYQGMEFATDTERQLAERVQQMEQFMHEQRLNSVQQEVDRRFAELSKQYGDIPFEQQHAVIQAMAQVNAPPAQIPLYWKGMFGIEQALRRGRDEGANTVRQKAGMSPPPAGIASRADEAPPEPQTLLEALKLTAAGKY